MPALPQSGPMTTDDLFDQGLSSLGINADNSALEKLLIYYQELLKWSKKINLIGDASERDIIDSHFLDSLTVLPYLDPCPPPGLIDVGTGAGFPGLPIKIVRPDLLVTLVEPRKKRGGFLRHMIRTLKLGGIKVIEQRIEENTPDLLALRKKTPLLISRAVTSIIPFLEMCEPFCSETGRVICMKGPKLEEELKEWRELQTNLGFSLSARIDATLPLSHKSRKLLIFSRHNS